MSAGHTPGPWAVSEKYGSAGAVAHKNGYIAFPCAPRDVSESRNPGESWLDMRERTEAARDAVKKEEAANAALIAQTPDLLAERDRLKAANAELAEALQSCIDYGTTPGSAWVFKKARAALEKHKGEAK